MEEKEITKEESLEIITRMVKTARGNIREVSFFFLFWGWIVVFGNAGQYILAAFTDYEHPYIVWLVGIPGIIITFWYSSRMAKKSRVMTYSDSIVFNTWLAFIPCLLIVIFFGQYLNFQISSLILLLTGFATYITGTALNYTPLRVGALIFAIATPISLVLGMEWSPMIMTVAIILGYLIPGYMLKNSK